MIRFYRPLIFFYIFKWYNWYLETPKQQMICSLLEMVKQAFLKWRFRIIVQLKQPLNKWMFRVPDSLRPGTWNIHDLKKMGWLSSVGWRTRSSLTKNGCFIISTHLKQACLEFEELDFLGFEPFLPGNLTCKFAAWKSMIGRLNCLHAWKLRWDWIIPIFHK